MKYATIKRGSQRVEIGSKQFKFLMSKKLPLSVVTTSRKGKEIKRFNVK